MRAPLHRLHKALRPHVERLKTYSGVRTAFAWCCIAWGVFAFFTPFTPASWLFFVGLVSLLGNDEAKKLVRRTLGEKYFTKFNLARFFRE